MYAKKTFVEYSFTILCPFQIFLLALAHVFLSVSVSPFHSLAFFLFFCLSTSKILTKTLPLHPQHAITYTYIPPDIINIFTNFGTFSINCS